MDDTTVERKNSSISRSMTPFQLAAITTTNNSFSFFPFSLSSCTSKKYMEIYLSLIQLSTFIVTCFEMFLTSLQSMADIIVVSLVNSNIWPGHL